VSVATAGRELIEQTQQRLAIMSSENEEDIIGDDEYESLPASAGLSTFMLAGAMAGILEHCACYPLDFIKTRMQSVLPEEHCRYKGVRDAFRTVSMTEGALRKYRGLNVVAVGAGPAHALYFSCYETMKKSFSSKLGVKSGQSFKANACAGVCATFVHDSFMNPVEVVKHRLQMSCSPYSGVADCIRTVYSQEGIKAFYRSFGTSFCMNAPFQVTQFLTYEFFQERLNPSREYSPWTHSISGGLAGAIAAALTTPFDVCKTVLNTQETCVKCNQYTGPATVSGFWEARSKIYAAKGMPGFYSGIQARVLFQMPATALSWSVYELFKYVISRKKDQQRILHLT